jgi:gamma-butyrobetaine dioxygenase
MTLPWDPPTGPAALRAALARDGHAVVAMGDVAAHASASPWQFAAALLGAEPRMVERQPIRPVAGGRSFASTDVFTPLHTDSQLHLGAPPDAQVMVCARPAERGGESLIADAWSLCDTIAARDPGLFEALLRTPRRIPFVFGDVYGPTLALRGDSLAFTHSPVAPRDPVAHALAPYVDATRAREVAVGRGEVLVLDNRSVLHGRRAFRDPARAFVRLLVWLDAPLRPNPRLHALAEAAAHPLRPPLAEAPAAVRARFGLSPPRDEVTDHRLRVVLELLRGGAPGAIAARERIPEPELYRWRDAAITAAAGALGSLDGPEATAAALGAALTRSGG